MSRKRGISPFAAGMIAIVFIAFALYAAFVHKYPWNSPYEVKAVFANANNLAVNSPVREAGVNVGKVMKVETKEGSSASVVTMSINDTGLPARQALNKSLDNAVPALKNVSIVNQALLGEEPHDLSKLIASTGQFAGELARHEDALQGLVSSFNTTMGAFASQATALQTSIHLLPTVLQNADSALLHLNNSFPPLRAFSKEILPGVNETAATVAATFPWITQTRGLVSQ